MLFLSCIAGCGENTNARNPEPPTTVTGAVFSQNESGDIIRAIGRELSLYRPDSAAIQEALAQCKEATSVLRKMARDELDPRARGRALLSFTDRVRATHSVYFTFVQVALSANGAIASTHTDSEGNFKFVGPVSPGRYIAVVRHQQASEEYSWLEIIEVKAQMANVMSLGNDAADFFKQCQRLAEF